MSGDPDFSSGQKLMVRPDVKRGISHLGFWK